ncbi:pathogenesis-related thaumatin-like protein 3.5 [Oryza brachyantha]|uniref:pathogenesis-related thaumatin-like protein 3.5 n=1 Tax=Oryza brachyantha TaxID=4533 RepID=UPI001ADD4797|nr:pathogenesis-related thaumatin-like protein 3.5 [Oryza brachyantha]
MACFSLLAAGVRPLLLPAAAIILLLTTLLSGPVVLVRGVTFRVVNKCPFPVWPATAPNAAHPVLADGGFFLPPGQSRRVRAPATWNGRFWGRTGCNFTSGHGTTACLTGDCEGRLACNGSVGAPPATVVEVDLHEDRSKGSSYDVSLVDGYNLPVSVWTKPAAGADADRKCVISGCAKNVNAVCPPELQVTAAPPSSSASAATVVACKSACLAFGSDAFCCRGAYGTAETCRGSAYSRLFRDACPAYVSYPYDTAAAAAARCYAQDYVVAFCPSRWGGAGDRVAQA